MGLRTKDDPSLITYSRVYETLDAIRNDLILYGQVYWEDPNEPEEDTYWYNLWRRLFEKSSRVLDLNQLFLKLKKLKLQQQKLSFPYHQN